MESPKTFSQVGLIGVLSSQFLPFFTVGNPTHPNAAPSSQVQIDIDNNN